MLIPKTPLHTLAFPLKPAQARSLERLLSDVAMRAALQRVRDPKVRIKIAAFIQRQCPHFLKKEGPDATELPGPQTCAGGAWEVTKHWGGPVS